nr:NADH dehydrogenase subunit 2 [Odontocerum albicorne]
MNLLFFYILLMSSIFSVSSNSWINMWMGMEINLLMFIPLMMNTFNSLSSQSMTSYFLIQAFASINFIFMILMKLSFNSFIMDNKNLILIIIMNLTLLMKMGAAPFYAWFPQVMKNLNWQNCLILSTWQKIIPMLVISYCQINKIIIISAIISALIGSLMGFNQTNLKLLMSFSSINHISWLLSSLMINFHAWLIYFIIYFMMNFIIMKLFNTFNMLYLTQIYNLNMNNSIKMSILINFLSLGGFPPFIGFISKWMVINNLIMDKMFLLTLILIFSSLINLFFYLRISFTCLMLNNYQIKWFNLKFTSLTHYTLFYTFFSSFTLINMLFIYQII